MDEVTPESISRRYSPYPERQRAPRRLIGASAFAVMSRSANMALDCVKGSLTDCSRLRRDWEAFGRRIDAFEENLETRKRITEAFLRDMVPPPADDVPDPLMNIENVEDI